MANNSKLIAVVDGESKLEYDRAKSLTADQLSYLDIMDREMDNGVDLGGTLHAHPDALARAQFVAINLIRAIENDDESKASATCAYLANRVPELLQVKADRDDKGQYTIDFVFDRPYAPAVKMDFVKLEPRGDESD